MRIVVCGGTGFIGQALARHLLAEGHEVAVLSRSAQKVRALFGGRVAAVSWVAAPGFAEGAGAVVNLTGENIGSGLWTRDKRRRIFDSRVRAGQAVAEAVALAQTRPKVVVQASAVGYYGHTGNRTVAEDSPPGKTFLAEVCRQWEPSSAAVEALGVRRVVIRSGIVLGPGGGVLGQMLPAFRLGLGATLGDGRQGLSWISLDDEVRAIAFLIENEAASGVFNLCAPGPVDNRTFAAALAAAVHRPLLLRAPALAIRLLLGDMGRELLLDGQFVKPMRLLETGFRFRYPELTGALAAALS